MAVFRVERNRGYTVMSNHHLRNKELSLKASMTCGGGWQTVENSPPTCWTLTLQPRSGWAGRSRGWWRALVGAGG